MNQIYAIKNKEENGKFYIGCTSGKWQKRLREHRCLLRAGQHKCKAFQDDWNRLGQEGFAIFILESFEAKDVFIKRERELYWMDVFSKTDRLYNENRISFQPPDGAPAKAAAARVANGYRPSAESNLKRRLAQLGKPKGHGAAISATKQARKLSQ